MTDQIYDKNGLVFYTNNDITYRRVFETLIITTLTNVLKAQNSAFEFVQVESPILTPRELVNANYADADMFVTHDNLVLRPETTMGTYEIAKMLLSTYNKRKYRLPLVVWQHGKSFRREQEQPTKFVRLKEFYQLECQIMYSQSTMNDYSTLIIPAICDTLSRMLGECAIQDSDRLPSYSEKTIDIIHKATNLEISSISKRTDFDGAKVLEVSIGTDRLLYIQNQTYETC